MGEVLRNLFFKIISIYDKKPTFLKRQVFETHG